MSDWVLGSQARFLLCSEMQTEAFLQQKKIKYLTHSMLCCIIYSMAPNDFQSRLWLSVPISNVNIILIVVWLNINIIYQQQPIGFIKTL